MISTDNNSTQQPTSGSNPELQYSISPATVKAQSVRSSNDITLTVSNDTFVVSQSGDHMINPRISQMSGFLSSMDFSGVTSPPKKCMESPVILQKASVLQKMPNYGAKEETGHAVEAPTISLDDVLGSIGDENMCVEAMMKQHNN